MSKQLGLVLIFSLLNQGLIASQPCDSDAMDQLRDCGISIGLGARGVLNATAMGAYCRGPGRTGNHCTSDYNQACLAKIWGTIPEDVFRNRLAFLGETVDYLCSNVDAIENDAECVNGQEGILTTCVMRAVRELMSELPTLDRSAVPETVRVDMTRRMGQASTDCIFSVLQEQCNQNIANVMGNFFYATLVYVSNL